MPNSSVLDLLTQFESAVVGRLLWPVWALRTIATLSIIILTISILQSLFGFQTDPQNVAVPKPTRQFRLFQLQYLWVYFLIMLADWLQGTNMYTLYTSYKVDVGTLFLTGFLSSAVFGTFLGMYVDRWGRKLFCIIFCILEIAINSLEHIPSMPALMVGRVLGGLSTTLLFSAFESWMVSEHRKLGFSEELLSSTFAIASWGNGVTAICAGFLAQASADYAGDIGPFQVAIALTVITLFFIVPWRENYGIAEENQDSSFLSSITNSLTIIRSNPGILCLGLSQAFFEGAVYSFVFLWVPTMLEVNKGHNLPTGLVFSCFMLAMTIGGMLFGIVLPYFPGEAEGLCIFVYATAAAAMAVPLFCFDFWWIFSAFLVLEAMVGMFGSCGATLRSRYYPESVQSSITTVFRLPLNLLVVVGTNLADNANDVAGKQLVFGVLTAMHVVAMGLQVALSISSRPSVPVAVPVAKAIKTE